jgi:hypothetical protein
VYTVNWIKSTKNEWLPLANVNLTEVTAQGVYVIWRGGDAPAFVRVGQGDIKSRLEAHRQDSVITRHGATAPLMVTWASVPATHRDGVERYLADRYRPLVGDAFPNVTPIQVNLVA